MESSSTRQTEIEHRLADIKRRRDRFKLDRAEAAELAATWVPVAHATGKSVAEIAQRSGLSRQAVYNLLNEKGQTE
jgi:hypothetical protein